MGNIHFPYSQIRDELSCIVYGSAMPKGLIEPRSTVEVPVLMQVTELDEQEVTAYISIFGDQDQHLVCKFQSQSRQTCGVTHEFDAFLRHLFFLPKGRI